MVSIAFTLAGTLFEVSVHNAVAQRSIELNHVLFCIIRTCRDYYYAVICHSVLEQGDEASVVPAA